MFSPTVALLCVLLQPWECFCVNLKNHVEQHGSQSGNHQSHRESLVQWKKSVAKDVLNSFRRSTLVKGVKGSTIWKKFEDIAYNEAHRYTGENKHGPAIGRLLRFVKQSSTDTDIWEALLWRFVGFEEALIYDPPEPQSRAED